MKEKERGSPDEVSKKKWRGREKPDPDRGTFRGTIGEMNFIAIMDLCQLEGPPNAGFGSPPHQRKHVTLR
jgi:hypothetical protein